MSFTIIDEQDLSLGLTGTLDSDLNPGQYYIIEIDLSTTSGIIEMKFNSTGTYWDGSSYRSRARLISTSIADPYVLKASYTIKTRGEVGSIGMEIYQQHLWIDVDDMGTKPYEFSTSRGDNIFNTVDVVSLDTVALFGNITSGSMKIYKRSLS